MDCEKFDDCLMDALYGELDELTLGALRRHVDACARCRGVWDGFESTRRAAVLPLEQPPSGLRERILAAERAEQRQAPWHRKLVRGVAWAGSHAMRPQLAMAALFMLVVGSSLLLLRGRHGDLGAPIEVTELGQPTRGEAAAPSPAAAAATGAAMAEAETGAARAKSARGAREGDVSEKSGPGATLDDGAGEPRDQGTPSSPAATLAPAPAKAGPDEPRTDTAVERRRLLAEALAIKASQGCASALGKLQALASEHAGTDEAQTAAREAASCAPSVGAGARPSGEPNPKATASAPPPP